MTDLDASITATSADHRTGRSARSRSRRNDRGSGGQDRVLLLTTVVLVVVIVAIAIGVTWSATQVTSAARAVDDDVAILDAYLRVESVVREQAFAEAAYRRSPSDERRRRLEDALDLLDDAVDAVREIGSAADRATVTRLLALNGRYATEVRQSLREGTAPPVTTPDDRVAGPALDAIDRLITAALSARTGAVAEATADQRSVIRRVIIVLLIVPLGGATIVTCCWWLLARRHQRLARFAAESDHAADHDPLTTLHNRRAFDRHLREALLDPDRRAHLLLLDLDGFKALNDTLGHPAGDAALVVLAERLITGFRDADLIARLGGDEFGIIATGHVDVERLARRIQGLIRAPIELDGGIWTLDASIGATTARPDDRAGDVLERADAALYRAKAGNGDGIVADAPATPRPRPGEVAAHRSGDAG